MRCCTVREELLHEGGYILSPEVAPLHWSTILHDTAAVIGCTAQADCMYVDTAWTLLNTVNSVNSLYQIAKQQGL